MKHLHFLQLINLEKYIVMEYFIVGGCPAHN